MPIALIENDDTPKPETRKASLSEMLELTRQADDDLNDIDLDLEDLGTNLRSKVDGIVTYLDHLEGRAKTLKEHAKQFAAKASSLEKKAERLRDHVAFIMDQDQMLRGKLDDKPKISGFAFELSLRYSESVKVINEPDANTFWKASPELKKCIRRSWEWDKPSLKKALKETNTDISNYAALKKTPYIKINPKS